MSAAAMMAKIHPAEIPQRVLRAAKTGPPPERRELAVLASPACHACHGTGARSESICNCVHRCVFRACLRKYQECRESPSRLHLEYVADFWLVAKRSLDDHHWRVFLLHFVGGLDWRACSRALHIDRGNFFHAVYRIENRLGRVFRELRPYALFPTDVYFTGLARLAEFRGGRGLAA